MIGNYPLHLMILVLLWGYIYTSWSLMGRLGLVSFGHAAFFGVAGYVLAYAAPQYQGPQPTYAGFWIRLVARLLDGLILGIPLGIVFAVFAIAGGVFANTATSSSQDSQNAAAATFGGGFLDSQYRRNYS